MSTDFGKFGKGNVSISKGGLSGSWVGIVVIIFVIWYFLKKLAPPSLTGVYNPDNGEYQGYQDVESHIQSVSDYIDWSLVPNEPSYYSTLGNQIHANLSGFWGEDEDAVMNILLPLNGHEVVATYVGFGSRASDRVSGNFVGGDLIAWLKSYMRDSQQGDLRTIFNRTGGVLNY